MRFGDDDPDACESSGTSGEIHLYPRVRALGIMLVEIGIGSPLPRPESEYECLSQIAKINRDWSRAWKYSVMEEPWPDFDYRKYRTAVKSCLDLGIFATAPFVPNARSEEVADGLKTRRKILYDCVVFPLEELLRGTGWKDELHKIGPLQSHARPPLVEPALDAADHGFSQYTVGRPTKVSARHSSRSMARALLPLRTVSSVQGTGEMPDPMDMEEFVLMGGEESIGTNTDLRR